MHISAHPDVQPLSQCALRHQSSRYESRLRGRSLADRSTTARAVRDVQSLCKEGRSVEREERSDRFTTIEDRFADYTVYDQDRKSTRLNSSHANISYAVFC